MAEPKESDEGQAPAHTPIKTGGKRNPAITPPPTPPSEPASVAPSDEPVGQSPPSGEPTSTPAATTTPAAATTPAPAESESTFFDYERIKDNPDLVAAHKDMQAAFTKKMQGVSGQEQAIAAYQAFQTDPHGTLSKIATQLGYNINPIASAGATPAAPEGGGNGQVDLENFNPQNWNEVVQTIGQQLTANVLQQVNQKFEPYLNSLNEVRKSTLETMLDQNCPDWRTYEDPMMENLKKHSSLVNDPEMLYRMSVPHEVLESRATQKALAKLKTAAETQPTGGSTTTRQAPLQPSGAKGFSQAVDFAKASLAQQGITGPWSAPK